MSKPRHNRFRIIVMVIVVILLHALPGSGNNLCHDYGGEHRTVHRPLVKPGRHTMGANDPTVLFDQLDRNNFKSTVPDSFFLGLTHNNRYSDEQKEDLLASSALTAKRDFVREQEQQRRRLERIQNDDADRQFEHTMKLNFQRNRAEESLKGDARKNGKKKAPLSKAVFLCKNPKKKPTLKPIATTKAATTTTESPPTEPPVTTRPSSPAPTTKKKESCRKKEKRIDQAALLQISGIMKDRALLIAKKLELLEVLIQKRWPAKSCKNKPAGDDRQATTTEAPEPTTTETRKTTTPAMKTERPTEKIEAASSNSSDKKPEEKTEERLDKPKLLQTTQSPFRKSHGFYFGFQPPGKDYTDEYLAAALREEQKLEQKVREEHQMQRENTRLQRQQRQRQQQQQQLNKRRYEAAPPNAARLESILMKNPSTQRSRYHGNEVPKMPQAGPRSFANKFKMGSDPDQIILSNEYSNEPLNNWKNVERCKRKRKKKLLSLIAANDLRPRLQRLQRQYQKARHRFLLNNPLFIAI